MSSGTSSSLWPFLLLAPPCRPLDSVAATAASAVVSMPCFACKAFQRWAPSCDERCGLTAFTTAALRSRWTFAAAAAVASGTFARKRVREKLLVYRWTESMDFQRPRRRTCSKEDLLRARSSLGPLWRTACKGPANGQPISLRTLCHCFLTLSCAMGNTLLPPAALRSPSSRSVTSARRMTAP